MKYYHACPEDSFKKIMKDHKIRCGYVGCIYLCDDPIDSLKFMVLRFIPYVYVIGVELPESEVEESFDHNAKFFRCKAYYTTNNISSDKFTDILEYDMKEAFKE